MPAQRGVDGRLADRGAVEAEVLPSLARDGVREHAVGRPGHRVHADEERRVAALLEELRVLGPRVLHDELAVRVEQVGQERVERVVAARAVAVHDDDLRRARRLRAADRRVDLLGVERARFTEQRVVAAGLSPLHDARDPFDVADHVHAHG